MKRHIRLTEGQLNKIVLNTAKRLIREGWEDYVAYTESDYYTEEAQKYVGRTIDELEEKFGKVYVPDESQPNVGYLAKNLSGFGHIEWEVIFDPQTGIIQSLEED